MCYVLVWRWCKISVRYSPPWTWRHDGWKTTLILQRPIFRGYRFNCHCFYRWGVLNDLCVAKAPKNPTEDWKNLNQKPLSHSMDVWYLCYGRNPASVDRYVVYPIIYRVSYIPGGCLGCLLSTVSLLGSWNNITYIPMVVWPLPPIS